MIWYSGNPSSGFGSDGMLSSPTASVVDVTVTGCVVATPPAAGTAVDDVVVVVSSASPRLHPGRITRSATMSVAIRTL